MDRQLSSSIFFLREIGDFLRNKQAYKDSVKENHRSGKQCALEFRHARMHGNQHRVKDMGVKSWEKTMCFAWGIARFDVAVQGRLTWGSCND